MAFKKACKIWSLSLASQCSNYESHKYRIKHASNPNSVKDKSTQEICDEVNSEFLQDIVLGLPNSASVSQEMDQLYQTLKGQCRAKTLALFSEKLASRSTRIKIAKEKLKELECDQDYQDSDPQVDKKTKK